MPGYFVQHPGRPADTNKIQITNASYAQMFRAEDSENAKFFFFSLRSESLRARVSRKVPGRQMDTYKNSDNKGQFRAKTAQGAKIFLL
jgi:hypothetical protein